MSMVTIGFSPHHAEVLPFARQHMAHHKTIVLEEPPSGHFIDMLEERISIDEYVMEGEPEFPKFERLLCAMLRELHGEGRRIVQVEPYLQSLLHIHELFAEGKTPEDILRNPRLKDVYVAEKRATGALLHYYNQCLHAPFEGVVDAVKVFARSDAARLKLRERLRSEAIKALVSNNGDIYVEAGYIHYPLYLYLKHMLGGGHKVRVVYLLTPVIRRLHGVRRNLGPGDVLTLYYALHGDVPKDLADLLAARSLIYIKLLNKEELLPGTSEAPHAEDIVRVNRIVDTLCIDDCRKLFDHIRLAKREQALGFVEAYGKQFPADSQGGAAP